MQNPSTNPPIVQAYQLATGFAMTRSLSVLIRLGIPDLLNEAAMAVPEIAARLGLDPTALFRFFRFLSKNGVVILEGDQCRLSPVGQFLRRDVPGSLAKGLELLSYEPWQRSWEHMEFSLRTGNSAFEEVYQMPAWAYFEKHPEYGRPFNEWMTALSKMSADTFLRTYDFSSFSSICDVGGGHGFLLKSILSRYPMLQGILYDLPFVVSGHELEEFQDRATIAGGSFFEKVPTADCLILKSILHDWNDDKALEILKNCAAALNPGGKLLAMDMVIRDGGNPVGYFYDLHMLVLLGGRERTGEEMQSLFEQAGLQILRFIPTGGPQEIIEAEKM